jgi:phosphoribosyl-AMP cyclohydrolase
MVSTYSQLQDAVASWLHRTDLAAVIPDFIALTEERMSRALRVREMETSLPETPIVDGAVAVPAGTVGVKALWVPGAYPSQLLYMPYEALVERPATGFPYYYARQGSNFWFDGAGSVQGVLYSRIPALSDSNTTNWMLSANPSAYLFGALAEANAFIKSPEAGDWDGRFLKALDEIAGSSSRDALSGPLVARVR